MKGAPQAELDSLATGTNRLAAVDGDVENGLVQVGQSLVPLKEIKSVRAVLAEVGAQDLLALHREGGGDEARTLDDGEARRVHEAEVAVFALPLAAAVLMPLILKAFGTVSLVAAYSAVLGYLLLGSACLAVGTWISALTENQILAYLATFGALLVAYIMDGIQTMFTTGNLLAFIAFMVVVLIASILVGVICKRLTAGVTVFCVGAVVLFILFRLRPAWLLTAFNAVLSALALFDPFQDIVGGMFSIPAIVYYLSVIGLFLFLTGQALERRRWN